MKITDKIRLDFYEKNPLVALVVFGRLAANLFPTITSLTSRQAADELLRLRASGRGKKR